MDISNFQHFDVATPQNQKFYFSKINYFKINFQDIQKTEYVVQNYAPTTIVQNFEPIYLAIFGCAMSQKSGNDDDVIFMKRDFLAFLSVVRQNKHFWDPEANLDKKVMF